MEGLQNNFLETLISEQIPVGVFLVSGVKLCGVIKSYDDKVLRLQDMNGTQIIYKQAVSTVMPEGYSTGLKGL